MEKDKLLRLDGVLWDISDITHGGEATALCPIHRMEMNLVGGYAQVSSRLVCDDCSDPYDLPRTYAEEVDYIARKIGSKKFKDMKVFNLDDEAIPLAETKISSQDNKFFLTAQMIKSRVGKRIVVYAGEKGSKEKTQIFIEPEIKRLAFDQKDLHPSDVFSKIEVTFKDGTVSSINETEQK